MTALVGVLDVSGFSRRPPATRPVSRRARRWLDEAETLQRRAAAATARAGWSHAPGAAAVLREAAAADLVAAAELRARAAGIDQPVT